MRVRIVGSVLATCLWLVCVNAAASQATTTDKAAAKPGEQAIALRQDMRKLWTDHVVWTRDYIIAAIGDAPDAPSALNRLLKNQDDIGNAVARFYGDAPGNDPRARRQAGSCLSASVS